MTEGSGMGVSGADHDREIRLLLHHVAEMTELSIGMVADGTRALVNADEELGRSVTARDAPLDRYDVDVEAEAIRLVAVLQPEGRDLRWIEALLKVANCVDRIGRLGYDLARNLSTTPLATEEPNQMLRRMDERARAMVTQAMHAFINDDVKEARAVFQLDDEVDDLYHKLQTLLIEEMRKGGPAADRLAYYLLGARHLERVADNACKIAEKAVYAIKGERRTEYFPPRLAQKNTP
jgi:phosphate transport system protein